MQLIHRQSIVYKKHQGSAWYIWVQCDKCGMDNESDVSQPLINY